MKAVVGSVVYGFLNALLTVKIRVEEPPRLETRKEETTSKLLVILQVMEAERAVGLVGHDIEHVGNAFVTVKDSGI